MARHSRMNNALYIIMSVAAMQSLFLAVFLGIMLQLGVITTGDLYSIGQVLVGNQKFALSKSQLVEYEDLKKEHEKQLAITEAAEGNKETRERNKAALDDITKGLQEQIRAGKELKRQNEQRLADLRRDIEKLKKDYEKEKKELKDWKSEETKAGLSARFDKLQRTLRAMDPELISNYFQSTTPSDSARIVRLYLTPEITAEVMGVLPEKNMRQILPLLENKYADMSSSQVVKAWTTPGTNDYKNPTQMAQYMSKMTVSQAFSIFIQLPTAIRAELARLLTANSTDAKAN